MKLEKWLHGGISALFSFVISLGGIGCLVTAFPGISVNMSTAAWFCGIFSIGTAVAFALPRGGLALLVLELLFTALAMAFGNMLTELEALVQTISSIYHSGYGWKVISWSGQDLIGASATGGVALLITYITYAVGWTVSRRGLSLVALVPGLLPLAACFVVTDTVPDSFWLFLLLTAVILLVLTQSVRRRSTREGIRLTATLLVPVMLFSILLFSVMPESTHEQQMTSLQQRVLSWFNGLPFVTQDAAGNLVFSPTGTGPSSLDLTAVGPRGTLRYPVMDIVSPRSELLYLRGQALNLYDGLHWLPSEDYEDIYWPTEGFSSGGWISIELRSGNRPYLYFPYYAGGKLWSTEFTGGALVNEDYLRDYEIQWMIPDPSGVVCSAQSHNELYKQCLLLPEETMEWAQGVLAEIELSPYDSLELRAEKIADFVRNSAEYDLNTDTMPETATDFARWFLEESDTGYCIHYATATTVLLRAAGIPARFVSGYTIYAQKDTAQSVTADRAHAWVEYIHPQQGWTLLDPTPEEALSPPTEPTETTETTAPTEAPATTAPTEAPTVPVTTAPTEAPSTAPTEASTAAPTETAALTETGNPGDPGPKKDHTLLLICLLSIGGAALLLFLLWLQYALRRQRRRKMLYSGPANRQAVKRWQYVTVLCRRLELSTPKELWTLTEKAAFSQHTLTGEELAQYDAWIRSAHTALQDESAFKRLMLKLIFALG